MTQQERPQPRDSLAEAILERANRLAEEYRLRAERSRQHILDDARQRLHLREEREVLLAKAQAERLYRRRVQAAELRLQREMDLLRWNLVRSVRARLHEELNRLASDEASCLELLHQLFLESIRQLPPGDYRLLLNSRDRERVQPVLAQWQAGLPEGFRLSKQIGTAEMSGGLRLQQQDDRLRLDNSFEGRLGRMEAELNQAILLQLLPPQELEVAPSQAGGAR